MKCRKKTRKTNLNREGLFMGDVWQQAYDCSMQRQISWEKRLARGYHWSPARIHEYLFCLILPWYCAAKSAEGTYTFLDSVRGFKTKRANRQLSLLRQHAVEFREVPVGWHPTTWRERLLCWLPYYRSYRLLHAQNSALRSLLQERSAKLADSDARIVELSHAREGLYRKCRERKRMLQELGVEV